MVSEWMEHGNINEFVGKNKHVNRTELVRRLSTPHPTKPDSCSAQLINVANGLAYMHGLRMAHGDLKGVRVSIKTSTCLSLIDKGQHPDQQGSASLPRRLRSLDHHWRRDSRHRWGIPDIVDLRRNTHVIYCWGNTSVDES
jgi:hypothetical protein